MVFTAWLFPIFETTSCSLHFSPRRLTHVVTPPPLPRLPEALRNLRRFVGDCCLYAFGVVESDGRTSAGDRRFGRKLGRNQRQDWLVHGTVKCNDHEVLKCHLCSQFFIPWILSNIFGTDGGWYISRLLDEDSNNGWVVDSPSYSSKHGGVLLRHLLYMIQPCRATEIKGSPVWLNATIMTHVFDQLRNNGVFVPLTDEKLKKLEDIVQKEYLTRKMKTITSGLNCVGQDMATLTMLLSFGSARGDLLDILSSTGPSAHAMGGYHPGSGKSRDHGSGKSRAFRGTGWTRFSDRG